MGDNNHSGATLSDISIKLTEELLKKFLKEDFGPDAQLVDYSIGGGSAKGDSYLSSVYRIKVQGVNTRNKKPLVQNFIAKGLPKSIGRRKTFRSVDFFFNEVAFYNQIVPSFYAFQDKQKPKLPLRNFPKCYLAVADGKNDVVVLEDLSYKNFQPVGRQTGLDFEQCKIILELMGRFHALSLAMKDKDPEEFKKISGVLQETYYKPELKSWYIDQLQLFTDIAIDAVSKELPEPIYEERIRHFTDNSCYEQMIEFVKPKEPYSAITHGDAWAPNFLFQYEANGSVQDIYIIDFQLARYASPILDISFFMYSCASRDVLFKQFDDVLQAYYKGLRDFIVDLGSSPDVVFPYKSFQNEVAANFAFGLGMSLESVPLSILEESETPDLESIQSDEPIPLTQIWALKPIKDKEGRMRVANNVKHAVDHGYI